MESSTQPGPIRIANRLFFLCVAAVILLLFAANRYAGFSFPVPWPDEAHFFWQAYAFYDHSTLFSPVLNTERIIMWMPPGYFVALGTVFKIVGASFAAARACSLVPMLVFFALLVRFLAGYGHRWFALICCTLFFLSGNFIAMGNVVRMEALVIAIVTGSFLLIQQRRFLIAIALLLLTPLFHFNGFYFLLSGLLFIWYKQGSEPRRKQVTKLSLLIDRKSVV